MFIYVFIFANSEKAINECVFTEFVMSSLKCNLNVKLEV